MKAERGLGPDMSPLPALGEVLDFMRLIWGVGHAVERVSKRMEPTLGITGPQRLVIRLVGKFPGIPAGHLAKLLRIHPSTLTGILKRVESQGIVRRRPDPRDGRRSLLGLTDKGRAFDIETAGTIEAAIAEVLGRTPHAKLEAARDVLASIERALGGLGAPECEE